MVQIILVRPATTEFDEQQRLQGTLDVPLSEQGKRQAARLADELADRGIERIYTCPGRAARQTADAVGRALDVPVTAIPQLRNVDLGQWQGRTVDEFQRTQPRMYRQWRLHAGAASPPGGEPLRSARQRVGAAVSRLLTRHRDGVVALVLPEPVAHLVRSRVVPGPVRPASTVTAACGCWEMITVEPARLLLTG
jgi:broad specificity phosphatase PhoE